MKTHIILFLTVLFVSVPLWGQQKKLTFHLDNVTVKEALDTIKYKGGYSYWFDADDLDVNRKVTVRVVNEPIEKILSIILKGTGTTYKIDKSHITIFKKAAVTPAVPEPVKQKKQKITGTILDERGEAIIGATVMVEGESVGVISDFDGKFAIEAPEHANLKVTYIGYIPQVFSAKKGSSVNIVLREDVKTLDEIVIVGYGSQKKETVVGAITTVRSKDIIQTPVSNITNALNGRLSGLVAMQRSGEPGRDDAEIYVRGMSTLDSKAAVPLYLVDGVERSFAQIDPNEIESITVLKDASATAVYGVRGANGVVIVTTRRGEEGPARVQFSAQVGFQNPTRNPRFIDSWQEAELYQEAYYNDNNGALFYTQNQLATIARVVLGTATEEEALRYPNTNWYKELTRKNAPQQQYNVNISGGSKALKYFVSAGYFSQGSFFKDLSDKYYVGKKNYNSNFTFDRYNFRSNVDVDVIKGLTATINMAGRVEKVNSPPVNTQDFFAVLGALSPSVAPMVYPGVGFAEIPKIDNPAGTLVQSGFRNQTNSVIESSIMLKYKLDFITKGLSARSHVSFDNRLEHTATYWENFETYQRNWNVTDKAEYQQVKQGAALKLKDEKYWNSNKRYYEAGIYYDRSFGVHDVTGLMLYNQQEYRDAAKTPYVYQGLVGRATYGYKHKYLAEFNVGYNGSENFAKGKRFGLFPAFSLGWVISEEPFLQNNKVISWLKVRGSYGEVGNDKLFINGVEQRFLYYNDYVQSGGYYFGDKRWENGIMEGRIGNDNVTWERAKKFNIGLEMKLFEGLLGMTVDVFKERRSNILVDQNNTVPKTTGVVSLPAVNIGKTQNKGIELELMHNNRLNENFSYYLKGNFTFTRNKVDFIDESSSIVAWQKQEGRPIGQRYLYECIGLFHSQEEIDKSPSQAAIGNPTVGDRKYRDFNNDGKIDEYDKFAATYTSVPEITYGLSLGGQYRNWDFSVLFQGVGNVTVDFWRGQIDDRFGRWSPFKTTEQNIREATYPALHTTNTSNNAVSSFGKFGTVYSGSYLKLKNVELGYSFPKKWTDQLGISDIRVYFNGSNLAILHDFLKYLDPESASGGGDFYPQMKVFNFGVNVTF